MVWGRGQDFVFQQASHPVNAHGTDSGRDEALGASLLWGRWEGFELLRREDTACGHGASGSFCLRGRFLFPRARRLFTAPGGGWQRKWVQTGSSMWPVTSLRPRPSHACSLSSSVWSAAMRGLLGPGPGHAAMLTASQPRQAPPRAAPLGERASGSRQRVGHR